MKKTLIDLLRINSQEELDKMIKKKDSPLECYIQLNFGVRSYKDISLDNEGNYEIYNYIDDTEETINHSQLMSTFIGEAISKGALYEC